MSTSGGAAGSVLNLPVTLAQGGTGKITAAAARAAAGLNIDSTRTVADANYAAVATDRTIVVTSITASRVITLPAANAYNPGELLTVKDGSASVSPLITITVAPNGTDTIDKAASMVPIITPLDQCVLVSDGATNWHAIDRPRYYGNCNGQSALHWALPNNVWTQVPLGAELVTDGTQNSMHPLNTSSTTVAVASNGVVLPTGTINVAATAGFPANGFLVITGPNGAGIDSVVRYTGTAGGNQFTGCTQGVGTLATGQVVKPANDQITLPAYCAWILNGIVTFPAIGNTTGLLGVRFFAGFGGVFAGGTQQIANPNAQATLSITTSFTQVPTAATLGIQAFQNSGATITVPIDVIEAPLAGGNFWTML